MVQAGEDAAAGVGSAVAGVDTDATVPGDTLHQGQPATKTRAPRVAQHIGASGDGSGTALLGEGYFAGGGVGAESAVDGLEGPDEGLAVKEELPDGAVGVALEAPEDQLLPWTGAGDGCGRAWSPPVI